ncbi:hypothetical protein BS47DRAFT_1166302 [Hydnum rufescens UP504]|uniref:Uncharacterized protein n=1 Tax=Hydnum rufescens UP504 TaxID=1448309 RepID=A0A9P6AT25_9AGAM|nr:hypothetical protein BS47DRAFT_1166302 [Hydnum rufescens UP504]
MMVEEEHGSTDRAGRYTLVDPHPSKGSTLNSGDDDVEARFLRCWTDRISLVFILGDSFIPRIRVSRIDQILLWPLHCFMMLSTAPQHPWVQIYLRTHGVVLRRTISRIYVPILHLLLPLPSLS